MGNSKVFVGRSDEIRRFVEVLELPVGKVVLVAGASGMGKSVLLEKLIAVAESHPAVKSTCLYYEITPTDDVDKLMLEIMGDCADAIQTFRSGAKNYVNKNRQKIGALFSAGGVIPGVGGNIKALGDLLLSLAEESKKGNARQQLLYSLNALSESLPGEARIVLFIDPEMLMPNGSADTWRLVMKDLPDKMLFVFAQRQEDALINNSDFCGLDKVVRIPAEELKELNEGEVSKLIDHRRSELPNGMDEGGLRKAIERYAGYPFAIQAAIDLVAVGVKPEELPERAEPVEFARMQIETIESKGAKAISLFEGYAVAEVAITDETAAEVAGIDSREMRELLADPFLKGLLRGSDGSRRIYHIILADEIAKKISEEESKKYHGRVASVYRKMLKEAEEKQVAPDATAVERLAGHVLECEGEKAFVRVFINECTEYLIRLGMYQAFIEMTEKALGFVKTDSEEKATLTGNLGVVYQTRGDPDGAEEMYKKSLEIDKKLGRLDNM